MTVNPSVRRQQLNTFVLLGILFGALQAQSVLPNSDSLATQVVTLLTAGSAYQIITSLLFWTINQSKFLLGLYWGNSYVSGIWSYEYTLDGTRRIGVWDIHQDVNGVVLVGNGLGPNFQPRTVLRSVSPLIPEHGGFFIINSRTDLSGGFDLNFSKTTLLLDRPRGIFKRTQTMRGVTEIFGGPMDRQIHPDVLFRLSNHDTVDELTRALARAAKTPLDEGPTASIIGP